MTLRRRTGTPWKVVRRSNKEEGRIKLTQISIESSIISTTKIKRYMRGRGDGGGRRGKVGSRKIQTKEKRWGQSQIKITWNDLVRKYGPPLRG